MKTNRLNGGLLILAVSLLCWLVPLQQSHASGADAADSGSATETSANPAHSQDKDKPLGGDFTLTDHHGKPFSLKQLRGKLVLIFFGYTYCPDVCPSELSLIARVTRSLGEDADKLAALFISIDPERDTPERLSQYVPFFSPSLIGLSGSPEEVNQVADAYNVQRKIHAHEPGDMDYLVDHSAQLFIVGRDGKLTNIIPYGMPAEHVLEIIRQEIKNQFTHLHKENER